jgi:TonB-linked SusC/RagA family outer membrane protein
MIPVVASGLLALLTAVSGEDAPSNIAVQQQTVALGTATAAGQLARRAGLSVRDMPLSDALTALAQSAKVDLIFSPSMLPERRVDCACASMSVAAALDRLLLGTSHSYSVRESQIIIVATGTPLLHRTAASAVPAGELAGPYMPDMVTAAARIARPAVTGTVTGVVTNRETGEPLVGAQVSVEGTDRGAVTSQEGRYLILGVPAGTHNVVVNYIGFNTGRRTGVVVASGGTAEANFSLETAVLALQQVTVTATVDPIEGVRTPFTVSRVGAEQLQVPSSGTALVALAGKVAGARIIRSTGQPGSGVNMMLRSPTSHQATNSPLLVIDGVVIGTTMDGTTMDFESLDIESAEIIKGAAAASLYGSRASAGVISITTNRGANQPLGQTRITSRTEYGASFLGSRRIPQARHHLFLMNEDGTAPVNAEGDEVEWPNRVASPLRIVDQPYPGPLFDNMGQLYTSGPTFRQNLTLSQRMETSSYLVSLTRFAEAGAMEGDRGLSRNDVRFTLDQQLAERLNLSFTGRHMRTLRSSLSGSPNISVLRYPLNVDLRERGPDGHFMRRPASDITVDNPLWRQYSRDNYQARVRTTASGRARLHAFDWLRFDAQLSYDRFDANYQVYVPKGTPTGGAAVSDGQLEREHLYENAYDGSAGATLLRRLGDLDARLSLRGTFELAQRQRFGAIGTNLLAHGVRSLDAAREFAVFDGSEDGSIGIRDERANGMFADLALNFRNKLTGNFSVRRDGSSLFGEQERWHTYMRAAGAYLISEESWFNLPLVNDLKLRYAMGEAGGRPGYSWQWERWQVDPVAGLTRFATAGNSQLRPHFTREQEVGIDIIAFNNRLSLELVRAWQVSRDQMITVPATVVSGYSSARANAGVLRGRTYEATIEVFPIRGRDVTWSLNTVLDNSRNYLAEWDRSCFWGSNASGREHEFSCSGERMGNFWMQTHVTSVNQLPTALQDRANEFAVNDDGYLVWVGLDPVTGQPNAFTDGIANELWGRSFTAGGETYYWGEPFLHRDDQGLPIRVLRGNSEPELSFGIGSNLRYRGLTVFGQFRGQVGGRIYNRTKHFMYALGHHADVDQSAKPLDLRKPIDYYQRALADDNDCTGTGCSQYIEAFLENGTYLKLGEVSVAYRVPQATLQSLLRGVAPGGMTLRVNAQNLFTLASGFTGYDPERGSPLSRIDTPGYPHLRSLTGAVEITF